jgi:hypothetical protein
MATKCHRRGGNLGGGKQTCSAWAAEHLPDNTTAPNNASPLSAPALAVYSGRDCIGFIRPRNGVFEALDLDRKSLGVFPTRHEAADALEDAGRG